MATVNITNRYTNPQKRYAEAIVATLPSMLEEGGQRLSTPPVYAQFGDDHTVSTVEQDTIMKKAYLIVDEAFAATATVTVTVGGEAVFTDAAVSATGLAVSATEDEYFAAGGDIVITLGTLTGDAEVGSLRVVLDTDSPTLKNGNYAAHVAV